MAEEDLIFGKNRHFFGGIEPSNMLAFTVSKDEIGGVTKVKIQATPPADTTYNGQILCSVAGAIIRRGLTDYPADEFDGTEITTVTTSETIYDETADPTGTYYYAAFPFSIQGVYNRSPLSRVAYNEPANLVSFIAKSKYDSVTDTVQVKLVVEVPSGLAKVVIRKSMIGFPEKETDGDAFQTITTNGEAGTHTLTDSDALVGLTYYYSAFPATSTGAYNRNPVNRASVTPAKYGYLFGFDLVNDDSNPATRVSYPSDVDNAGFTPVQMNFNTGVMNPGSWDLTPGNKFMPRPCSLYFDGTLAHYIDPNDYSKNVNGGGSGNTNLTFGANVMMEWPKIYTKRWEENGVYHFRCCDIKLDEDYECWCNYDRLNNEINHFYMPVYHGYSYGGRARSVSGFGPSTNMTVNAEVESCLANGADWYTDVLADRLLVQDLLVLIGRSTDCQAVFGRGRSGSGLSSFDKSGLGDTRGMFYGYGGTASIVKVFGMENFWGNVWRRTAGLVSSNGSMYTKITRGTKDGTSVSDYNLAGSGYRKQSKPAAWSAYSGSIKKMTCAPYGRLPYDNMGSVSTYETDIFTTPTSDQVEQGYAVTGGDFTMGDGAGAFTLNCGAKVTVSAGQVGYAPSCKPCKGIGNNA